MRQRPLASPLASRGLTLLEALVALAILGAGFGAVLDLQAQLVRGLAAVERAHQRTTWRLNAIEIAASVQREADRTGTVVFRDGSQIDWRPGDSTRSWSNPSREGFRERGVWRVTLAPVAVVARQRGQEVFSGEQMAVSAELPPPPAPF